MYPTVSGVRISRTPGSTDANMLSVWRNAKRRGSHAAKLPGQLPR